MEPSRIGAASLVGKLNAKHQSAAYLRPGGYYDPADDDDDDHYPAEPGANREGRDCDRELIKAPAGSRFGAGGGGVAIGLGPGKRAIDPDRNPIGGYDKSRRASGQTESKSDFEFESESESGSELELAPCRGIEWRPEVNLVCSHDFWSLEADRRRAIGEGEQKWTKAEAAMSLSGRLRDD